MKKTPGKDAVMIFWFSGTGNSRYVARRLAGSLQDRPVSIADAALRQEYDFALTGGERLGFVMPTYFWGIPSIAADFLSKLRIDAPGRPYTYAVFTAGGSSCDAVSKIRSFFPVDYSGEVMMPDNYILKYDRRHPDDLKILLRASEEAIDLHAGKLLRREAARHRSSGLFNILATKLRYPSYEKRRRTADFFADEKCTGCGFCAEICPERILSLVNGRAVFRQPRCTFCLACIHRCPQEAMQYGKKTAARKRYVYPDLAAHP